MTRRSLFATRPGADFAREFALGFFERHGDLDPLTIARIRIYVNTRPAERAIREALADLAPRPGPLPRLVLMSELYTDPLLYPDIPPAISTLKRQLQLTRLVEQYLRIRASAGEAVAPASAAPDLAEALALLIDQFHDEGLSPESLTDTLAGSGLSPDVARHWEDALAFFDLIRTQWPRIRDETEAEGPSLDPRERQRAVIERMTEDWAAEADETPVIAAASTGSVGTTALLLAAIARHPMGAVVLPALDPAIERDIWQAAGPDHPVGPFQALFRLTCAAPEDVTLWREAGSASARNAIMAQALRPAPVTDHWHAVASDLHGDAVQAMAGMTLLEADQPAREAEAIALAIREAVSIPEQTVSLITPDGALARQVASELERYAIVPDDTIGQPLHQSPPAVLMRMIVELASSGTPDPVRIVGLLQHPLVAPGCPRREHLTHARAYERRVLRETFRPSPDGVLPAWQDATEVQADWLGRVDEALRALGEALPHAALTTLMTLHRRAAETLTDAGDGPTLYREGPGEALATFLDKLIETSPAYGDAIVPDYPALLLSLMRGEQLRPLPRQSHPRVSFIGPREARLSNADVVILAGLNDGVWPEIPDPGPWLSRPMREALGMPLPERAVGLSAHDFLNAICRPTVILSRARKAGGAATVASRWLIRLETLMRGVGAEDAWIAAQARGHRLLELARGVTLPTAPVARAPRPRPAPPAAARPRRLSVTEIERLVRDAYEIYARHVLKLRPLEPLGRQPDARDRGKALHTVLEHFSRQTPQWPGEAAALSSLLHTADQVLAEDVPWPDLRRFWRARIERFAPWFIAGEAARRDAGHALGLEIRGEMDIDLPAGPFRIVAKADRIDALDAGGAAIYDYKTGTPPSLREIEAGFGQQLHLQGAILQAGGFDGIPAMTATTGAYIGLTGSGDGGKDVVPEDLPGEIGQHMDSIVKLLAAYDAGASYVARGRVQREGDEGDYDHLARFGEWDMADTS